MFSPAGIAAEIATFAGMIEAELPTLGGLAGANPTLIANVTQGVTEPSADGRCVWPGR